jgi:hypothetical protein
MQEPSNLSPAQWNQLAELLPTRKHFMSGYWLRAWAESFVGTGGWAGPMYFVTAGSNSSATSVLPFCWYRVAGVRFLSLAGYYSPFRSVVLLPDHKKTDVAEMVQQLGTAGSPLLRLGPCEETDSDILLLIDNLKAAEWRLDSSCRGIDYVIRLGQTQAEFFTMVSKGLLKNIAYCERRLKKENDFQVMVFTGDELANGRAEIMGELGSIENDSWLRKSGDMRFAPERNKRFWLRALAHPSLSDNTRVWIMYLNGRAVSFCFCIDAGDCRYVLANNYTEDVAPHSTGSILYHRMFIDAFERRIASVNLGQGDSGYKARWGATPDIRLMDYTLFAPGFLGRVAQLAFRSARVFQKAQNKKNKNRVERAV